MYARRKRRRRSRYRFDARRLLRSAGCLAAVVILAVVGWTYFTGRGRDRTENPESSDLSQTVANIQDTAEPTPSAMPEATQPQPSLAPIMEQSSNPSPTQFIVDGLLPVVHRNPNAGNKIAITVDDCFRSEHVEKILELASQYGAKITFFPIGRIVKKDPDLWKRVVDAGHEIENHTYSHSDVTKMNEDELRRDIERQNYAISKSLNANYPMRFLRPMGGGGTDYPTLHKILIELDYMAVADWGALDSQGADTIIERLKPGQIILFHATAEDYEMLKRVMPAAIQQGYEMVTMTDLYGLSPKQLGTFVERTFD